MVSGMSKALQPATIVCQLGSRVGSVDLDVAEVTPADGIPIVDQSGKVIGYANVSDEGLVWCRTDGATAEQVSVGCGPVSIGGRVKGEE